MAAKPLSVGTLVEIERGSQASGHIKCWEHFAAAAVQRPSEVDLTVYFLGDRERVVELSDNVRYVILPPRLGTRRIPLLRQGAGDTDLAAFHPELARRIGRHDVVHATMFFAYGRTALRSWNEGGPPVVASVHTDLARFTRVYTEEVVRGWFGTGRLSSFFLDRLGVARRAAAAMDRALVRNLRQCQHVMVSKAADLERLRGAIPDERLSFLRRGVDRDDFSPTRRDRAGLTSAFAIPPDRTLLLFVGRIDESKNAMTLARAIRRLADGGGNPHLLAVGDGSERQGVAEVLGDRVTLTGTMSQEDLPPIYASADIFVFPSRAEVAPNAVLEARASGLPVIVADADGGGQFVARPGVCGVVVGDDDPSTWAAAIARLADDPDRRRAMGQAARRWIESEWPTWEEVLDQDLLPVWRRAAGRLDARAAA